MFFQRVNVYGMSYEHAATRYVKNGTRVYALYENGALSVTGTLTEIANTTGLAMGTLWSLASDSYKKRLAQHRISKAKLLIPLDAEEDDEYE